MTSPFTERMYPLMRLVDATAALKIDNCVFSGRWLRIVGRISMIVLGSTASAQYVKPGDFGNGAIQSPLRKTPGLPGRPSHFTLTCTAPSSSTKNDSEAAVS